MKSSPRSDLGLLVLRVVVGLLMAYYGSQKVFGLFGGAGYQATIDTFRSHLSIRPVFTDLCMAAELGGGVCLVLGLLTPLAAFALSVNMGVAFYENASRPEALTNFLRSGNPGDASNIGYPLLICAASVAILIMGGGRYSIDAKLFKRKGR